MFRAVLATFLTLSARTEKAVKNLASRYEKHFLDHTEDSLADICFTANAGRSHFARRVALVAESKEQLGESLAAIAAGRQAPGVVAELRPGHSARRDGPRMAFLFGASDSHAYAAYELYGSHPVFRSSMPIAALSF